MPRHSDVFFEVVSFADCHSRTAENSEGTAAHFAVLSFAEASAAEDFCQEREAVR
jgi:hypothetical protein